ncbi:MAG: hypothetical protein KJO76_02800 [Gammaproteobacteria bacterium]|nr:hypothetical protein [Gammaproteobacteria bacterium]
MYDIFEAIRELLDRGGNVMVLLAWVIFVMWTLVIERLMFMLTENRIRLNAALAEYESRRESDSWNSQAIYGAVVSRLSMRFESRIELIRILARLSAVCIAGYRHRHDRDIRSHDRDGQSGLPITFRWMVAPTAAVFDTMGRRFAESRNSNIGRGSTTGDRLRSSASDTRLPSYWITEPDALPDAPDLLS